MDYQKEILLEYNDMKNAGNDVIDTRIIKSTAAINLEHFLDRTRDTYSMEEFEEDLEDSYLGGMYLQFKVYPAFYIGMPSMSTVKRVCTSLRNKFSCTQEILDHIKVCQFNPNCLSEYDGVGEVSSSHIVRGLSLKYMRDEYCHHIEMHPNGEH